MAIRRKIAAWTAAAILGVALVGCGSAGGGAQQPSATQGAGAGASTNTPAGTDAGSPEPAGDGAAATQEIVIGEQFDLASIDPADGMLDDTQVLVYNQLVELDTEFRQIPGLAESWEMSDDGKVWTFKLREGVAFHDGNPWNAEAAVKNLERQKESPAMSKTEKLETPDDYTLVFYLNEPSATFASELSRTSMSMVSPAAIKEDGTLSEAIGTGPYRLAKWDKDMEYIFEANGDYWGGAPNIKKITFKVITDPQSRAMALESGEIDMMSGYQSLAAIKKLMGDDRFQVVKKTQNTSSAMFYNMEREPLNTLEVRQAIGHALDLESIVNSLLPGLASPPTGFFSPAYGELVNPDVKMPAYDVEKANTLLNEAGWKQGGDGIREKDGKKLELGLTYGAGNSEDSLLAPVLQDELKKVGIDLRLNAVEGAALGELQETKEYDIVLAGQSFIPTDDPSFNYTNGYWHSESYYKIYTSAELDAVIGELKVALDAESRKQLHWDIQKQIMDQAPTLVVYHRNSIRLAKANIKNFDIASGCWHINRALKDAVVE